AARRIETVVGRPFYPRPPAARDMDNVERMFRHLVRVIQTRYPQYLTQPFDVAELHQNILPYRHHRRELGLETNEDYEITMLELRTRASFPSPAIAADRATSRSPQVARSCSAHTVDRT